MSKCIHVCTQYVYPTGVSDTVCVLRVVCVNVYVQVRGRVTHMKGSAIVTPRDKTINK